ncbi:M56 family metallopeptidase [uncultured Gemmiger sp.]|uniref:M56 family metallopeptidase n=1 Tax=uncultured Gemmiger sp. TaxID=1623490 RepID=UPI0025F4DCE0|nr:M56 family metallopeptidase [uncultured Gemmiger sp.]
MSAFVDWMLAFAAQGIPLGCAALVLLALARRLRRRYGARWLCRLWLALAVLFVLPLRLALPAVPAARVTLPAAWTAAVQTAQTETPPQQGLGEQPALSAAAPAQLPDTVQPPAADSAPAQAPEPLQADGRGTSGPAAPALSWLEVLTAMWLTGAAAVLLWQGAAYLLWRRRTVGQAVPAGPDWQQALDDAQAAVPLRRRPRLLASASVRGPVTAGILRPVLLVPQADHAPVDSALMLTHELTHLRRHDLAFKLLLTAACALHWYNPVLWLLARRAGRDIEAACDEQVVAGQGSTFRAAYSDALLHAARMGRTPALTTGFALTRRDWADRLRQLWDLTPKRRGRVVLAGLALVALLAGGLVACQAANPVDTQMLQAPEYPWTTTYSAAKADLDAAGTPYTDGGDTLQLRDAALFGCQMQELNLRFNSQGQLWGVSGLFPAEEQDAVIDAVTARLGEPLPEFTYVTTFDVLTSSAEYRAHREDLTGNYAAVWAGTQTLGEAMTEQQRQNFRERLRECYTESGAGFAGRTETAETAGGTAETIWYGEDAVDAILTNPATLVRCIADAADGQAMLTVEHTPNSLDTLNQPAPTSTPAPDHGGTQEVWPGLIGWPTSLSVDPPAALAGLPYWQMDDYTVPDIGRTGYAATEPGGVALYTTLDGGANWQEQHADLTPALGQEPFAITNYQMVSDSTGFLVVRLGTDGDAALGDGSLRYWTDDDCAVLRTTDGGATWQLTGRHSLPADAERGAWHLQPFLWLNENVGFWAPHTSYTHFSLWRTVDGGASWQPLDLTALESQLPESRTGIHTCSLWLDPDTPGGVWVRCAPNGSNSLENDFGICTNDYGETWRMADWQPQVAQAATQAPNGGEPQ